MGVGAVKGEEVAAHVAGTGGQEAQKKIRKRLSNTGTGKVKDAQDNAQLQTEKAKEEVRKLSTTHGIASRLLLAV